MRTDWTDSPFAIEHVVKVTSLFAMLIPGGVAYSAAWRLSGHPALEMMVHPYVSRTPAEFWRRYNLPAQQFFYERVFKPSGGRRHPIRGTLLTFLVSALIHELLFAVVLLRVEGYQTAFFMLQGLVVAATMRFRPRGWWSLPGWLATVAFMYTSSVLFFASFESVLDVYDNPLPWDRPLR
jgi:D-alanyl-lipoteichoic acid acyltransferase DltB (MBOAT superfamily)